VKGSNWAEAQEEATMNEQDDLKATDKEFEAVIDRMLANKPAPEEISSRYAEKTAVATGEKLKEIIVEELLGSHSEPVKEVHCPSCGKRLGMKDYRSRQVVTEAGETQITRAYYYSEECHHGIFPPWMKPGA
jgi:hypothetical protein